MITPSTACSFSLLNAPVTSPCVGRVTGIRMIENPSATTAAAMASSVRLLPNVGSAEMITPMLRNLPLRSARAALLGR